MNFKLEKIYKTIPWFSYDTPTWRVKVLFKEDIENYFDTKIEFDEDWYDLRYQSDKLINLIYAKLWKHYDLK